MSHTVKVVVRFRPFNETEKKQDTGSCIRVNSGSEVDVYPTGVAVGHDNTVAQSAAGNQLLPKPYTFDSILPPSTTQEDLFEKVGVSTADTVMSGYNGTVLAYGQTGSGKTHSMLGPGGGTVDVLSADSPHRSSRGFLPRVVEALFERLHALPAEEYSFTLHCSVFELYKENINDLLSQKEDSSHQDYRIREDIVGGKGIYVENLYSKKCSSASEVMEALKLSTAKRRVASTGSNDTSSRSHSLTVLTVEQVNHVKGGTITRSKLNVVDLAGSEKVGKTQATGERLKEAQMINLSLTLLGNVIYKLTDGKSKYIPYRDSKLTRLLQEAFGGNACTTLLCHASTAHYNREETVSTLQFAARAKQIKNKPRVNRQLSADELQIAYQHALDEIRALKDRLAVKEEKDNVHSSISRRRVDQSFDGGSVGGSPVKRVVASSAVNRNDTDAAAATTTADCDDCEFKIQVVREEYETEMESLRVTIDSLMKQRDDLEKDVFNGDTKLQEAKEQVEFYNDKWTQEKNKLEELMGTNTQLRRREELLEKHRLDLEAEITQMRSAIKRTTGDSANKKKSSAKPSSAISASRKSSVKNSDVASSDVSEMPAMTGAAIRLRRTSSTSGAPGGKKGGPTQRVAMSANEVKKTSSPITPSTLETMEVLQPLTPPPQLPPKSSSNNNNNDGEDGGAPGSRGTSPIPTAEDLEESDVVKSDRRVIELQLRVDELERLLAEARKKLVISTERIAMLETNCVTLNRKLEQVVDEKDTVEKKLDATTRILADVEKENGQMKQILDALGIDLKEQIQMLSQEKDKTSALSLEAGRLSAYNNELEAQRDQADFCELASMEVLIKTEDVESIERELNMIQSGVLDFAMQRASSNSVLGAANELGIFFGNLAKTLKEKGTFVTSNLEAQRLNIMADCTELASRCAAVRSTLVAWNE